jgi:hypothetical protein
MFRFLSYPFRLYIHYLFKQGTTNTKGHSG